MKKTITLGLFILLSVMVSQSMAQAPLWNWAKTSGDAMEDNGKGVATDGNANVFVTGFFRSASISFGAVTLTNADASGNTDDVFLVKYDPSGLLLWATSFGTMGNDEGSSVSCDVMGNVYVTGSFSSDVMQVGLVSLTNSDPSGQHYDVFVAKYNAAGTTIWAKRYGGMGDDNATGINTDVSGNTYLTGAYSSDTIFFDTTALTLKGNFDIFLAKLNVFGDVQWARNAGGDAEDKSLSVSTDSLGNIGITGYFYSDTISFGTTTLMKTDTTMDTVSLGTTNDVFVARYNSSGDLLWVKSAGGYGGYFDEVSSNGISMNSTGDLYVTGYFRYDSINFDGLYLYNYNTSRDCFIVKYDSTGTVLWASSAGQYLDDEGRGIVVDAHGDILITGYYSSDSISFDGNPLSNPYFDSEVFVVKYDPNGSYIWGTQAGGSTGDIGNSIAVHGTNNVYVTGQYYSSTATFDSFNLTNAGFGDIFVSRLYPFSTVDVATLTENKNGLVVYPNPSNDNSTLFYTLKSTSDVKIDIYNELGERVITIVNNENQSEGNYHYSFTAPQTGIYIVKLQTNEGVLTQKIIFTN